MFTGIIESLGEIIDIQTEGTNIDFFVKSDFTNELKIDQSIAHNGTCLTVVEIDNDIYKVTAIKETLDKTNLGDFKRGTVVNLERCTKVGSRLDGHIVQGHIDTTGICTKVKEIDGSWEYSFEYESKQHVTVEKGSITINGVSLTVVNSKPNEFSVAIIPFTHEHTNFKQLKVGDRVNLEFDIIGKYVSKLLHLQSS